MHIDMNTELKMMLTPKHDKVVYSWKFSMPVYLKEDPIVKLVLLWKYGIITVLPFSKYANPNFAQWELNGKLRLLIDMRKINNLFADVDKNNNLRVSTL